MDKYGTCAWSCANNVWESNHAPADLADDMIASIDNDEISSRSVDRDIVCVLEFRRSGRAPIPAIPYGVITSNRGNDTGSVHLVISEGGKCWV